MLVALSLSGLSLSVLQSVRCGAVMLVAYGMGSEVMPYRMRDKYQSLRFSFNLFSFHLFQKSNSFHLLKSFLKTIPMP